jgi:hypothetical protein
MEDRVLLAWRQPLALQSRRGHPYCWRHIMRRKGYKFIPTEYGIEIAIPDNLPPDQEAALIAKRLAEIDPIELAAELKDLAGLRAHPERAIPLEDVLRDLESMNENVSQDAP